MQLNLVWDRLRHSQMLNQLNLQLIVRKFSWKSSKAEVNLILSLAMKTKKLNVFIGAIKQLLFAWLNVILMITVACQTAGEIKINAIKVSFLSEITIIKVFRMSLQRRLSKWMWKLSTLELSPKSDRRMSCDRELSLKRWLLGSWSKWQENRLWRWWHWFSWMCSSWMLLAAHWAQSR